jgi:sugar lactone lactonase YvrE
MKQFMFLFFICLQITIAAQQSFIADNLEKKWHTVSELKTPESVCYDQQRNIIYVSNIAGGPSDKDNNGFITTLSPDGKVLQLEWCKGLSAPKGMGITGNFLFVSDIDEIVKIDIGSQKIVQHFRITGSKFLNDVTVDKDGTVYVSDMNDNAIYRIKNSAPELFVKSEQLNQPNGLFASGNNLFVGLRDRIVCINLKSREIRDYILNTGGIDGIVPDGKGNHIISDWLGNVYLVHPENPKIKLLDTTPDKINAADIEFIPALKLLLVPTFGDNRVMAYELK